MFNVRRSLWVACGVIGVAGAPAGAQVIFERGANLDPDGQFRIMMMEGAVTVSGWDRDSVWVRASLDEQIGRAHV